MAANRKEASDKTAHFFRAKEVVTRGRERESNMTAALRLESHLKKGRRRKAGEGRPILGPKDARGEVKAQRSISISFASHMKIS